MSSGRRPGWIEEVNAAGVARVASQFDLVVAKRGNYIESPCFECGATARSKHEKGAIGFAPDRPAWRCYARDCDAMGDAVDLASYAHFGTKKPPQGAWEVLHLECESRGLCSSSSETGSLLSTMALSSTAGRDSETSGAPHQPITKGYPRPKEVEDLWGHSQTCLDAAQNDDAIGRWLVQRKLEPSQISENDLARVIPAGLKLPQWGWRKQPWNQAPQQWRILVPLFDVHGTVRSVQARALSPEMPRDKAANPSGYQVSGLVMACRWAQRLLRGEEAAIKQAREFGVVVVEGLPDFLTWAARYPDAQGACPVIFGVVNGSWTAEIAHGIPSDVRVAVRTHNDAQGIKYAQQVIDSLRGRCKMFRRILTEEELVDDSPYKDENDHWVGGTLSWDPFEGLTPVMESQPDLIFAKDSESEVQDEAARLPIDMTEELGSWWSEWKGREGVKYPPVFRAIGSKKAGREDYTTNLPNVLFDIGFLAHTSKKLPQLLPVLGYLLANVHRSSHARNRVLRTAIKGGLLVTKVHQEDMGAALGFNRDTGRKYLAYLIRLGWIRPFTRDGHGVGYYSLGQRLCDPGKKKEEERYFYASWVRGVYVVQRDIEAAGPKLTNSERANKRAKIVAQIIERYAWCDKQKEAGESARADAHGDTNHACPSKSRDAEVRFPSSILKEDIKGRRELKEKHTVGASGQKKHPAVPSLPSGSLRLLWDIWSEEWEKQKELEGTPKDWTAMQRARLEIWVEEVGMDFARASFCVLLRTWPKVKAELKNSPGPPTPLTVRNNDYLAERVALVLPVLDKIDAVAEWSAENPFILELPAWAKAHRAEVDQQLASLGQDLIRLL